jgi:hypothetical protein
MAYRLEFMNQLMRSRHAQSCEMAQSFDALSKE